MNAEIEKINEIIDRYEKRGADWLIPEDWKVIKKALTTYKNLINLVEANRKLRNDEVLR